LACGSLCRYVKFVLRAAVTTSSATAGGGGGGGGGARPLVVDAAECAFVVARLRDALRSNAPALRGFWFKVRRAARL